MQHVRSANVYLSTCCKVAATKDACLRTKEDLKEKKYSQSGLGKWHCPNCGKKCTVTPVRGS